MSRPAEQQLELEVVRIEPPHPSRARANGLPRGKTLGPRLALSPDEAAALLGVSRDYFDEHVLDELRIVRRGRRILVALSELERSLDRARRALPSVEPDGRGDRSPPLTHMRLADGKRCNCEPGYRVAAYDAISKRKVSKTFRTLGEARAWRATAQTQAAKGIRLAGHQGR